eukprot:4341803-Alexandrium_andersonii.AAC.1
MCITATHPPQRVQNNTPPRFEARVHERLQRLRARRRETASHGQESAACRAGEAQLGHARLGPRITAVKDLS